MLTIATIVGCKSDGEKAADTINDEAAAAEQLGTTGINEYKEAYEYGYGRDWNKMSIEQLDWLQGKLSSSQHNLTAARKKYQHILDTESENKDSIKLIGKLSVINAITKINELLFNIETDLKKVEIAKVLNLKNASEKSKMTEVVSETVIVEKNTTIEP